MGLYSYPPPPGDMHVLLYKRLILHVFSVKEVVTDNAVMYYRMFILSCTREWNITRDFIPHKKPPSTWNIVSLLPLQFNLSYFSRNVDVL
jgi:hypothetical protein